MGTNDYREIGGDTIEIIAEIGVNWLGDIDIAKEMIVEAKQANCDYVKFQLFNEFVIKESPLRDKLVPYILDKENAQALVDFGRSIGQVVFFTPMFMDAIDWIVEMKVPMIKIRLADQAKVLLGTRAQATGIPILASISSSYINDYLTIHPETTCSYNDTHQQTRFLYCVGSYPAHPDTYRFLPSDFIGSKRPGSHIIAGVSDHTSGFEVMQRAKECGAEFCEVHVKLSGTDPIEERWSKTFEEVGEFQLS